MSLVRLLRRLADIRISEREHGPADARRYEYSPTYMLRGLERLASGVRTGRGTVSLRHQLDPEVAAAIKLVPVRRPDTSRSSRRCAHRFGMPGSDRVERTDRVVPGDPAVPVRVHQPRERDGAQPCVYSIHGGGYVLGTNLMDDPRLDELCPKLGLVGVSVEYRLAPETPYPGPARGLLPRLAVDVRARGRAGHRPGAASA